MPQLNAVNFRSASVMFPILTSLHLIDLLCHCFRPPSRVVADFGCGDCKIARSVKNKVHSFDLAATCDLVTVCDMAHVSMSFVVFLFDN